jgi:hypothetical protein
MAKPDGFYLLGTGDKKPGNGGTGYGTNTGKNSG